MSERIIIDTVDKISGKNNGDELKGCYFKLRPNGGFDFHSKDDHVIPRASNVCVGASFSFKIHESSDLTWTLTITAASTTSVTGGWTDSRNFSEADGSYQAQAGDVPADEESASSAYV